MRSAKLSAIVVALIVVFSCDTDKNVLPTYESYFTKYYGSNGNQEAVDLLVNDDGTMVLLGNSSSQISTEPRPFITKVDKIGNVLWQLEFGKINQEARDVEPDGAGGYYVVSNILGIKSSIEITQISQSGVESGATSIEANVSLLSTSITATGDGLFLITGSAGPDFVPDPELGGRPDEADLVLYSFDPRVTGSNAVKNQVSQGGEHVGRWVKAFKSKNEGSFVSFGDSDRALLSVSGLPKRSLECYVNNEQGIPTGRVSKITDGDFLEQIASTAIETSQNTQESYLLIGTSYTNTSSSLFFAQYVIDSSNLTLRFGKTVLDQKRMEGVATAVGTHDNFFLLGNEIRDNNTRDIVLIETGNDGNMLGYKILGSPEGNDVAAGVKVLPDGRIVVFGTIQLATQRKIALFVIAHDDTFTR